MPFSTGRASTTRETPILQAFQVQNLSDPQKPLFCSVFLPRAQAQTEICRTQKEEPRKHNCEPISLDVQK